MKYEKGKLTANSQMVCYCLACSFAATVNSTGAAASL